MNKMLRSDFECDPDEFTTVSAGETHWFKAGERALIYWDKSWGLYLFPGDFIMKGPFQFSLKAGERALICWDKSWGISLFSGDFIVKGPLQFSQVAEEMEAAAIANASATVQSDLKSLRVMNWPIFVFSVLAIIYIGYLMGIAYPDKTTLMSLGCFSILMIFTAGFSARTLGYTYSDEASDMALIFSTEVPDKALEA